MDAHPTLTNLRLEYAATPLIWVAGLILQYPPLLQDNHLILLVISAAWQSPSRYLNVPELAVVDRGIFRKSVLPLREGAPANSTSLNRVYIPKSTAEFAALV